jgi:hypothetical protein
VARTTTVGRLRLSADGRQCTDAGRDAPEGAVGALPDRSSGLAVPPTGEGHPASIDHHGLARPLAIRSLAPHLPRWISGAPLDRVRLLFLVFAVANGASIAVANAEVDGRAPAPWLAGIALPLLLSAYWAWGHRRGGFPAAGEPLEALALLAIVHATPGEPFLPLFGLMFRSAYGGSGRAFARYVLWAAALATWWSCSSISISSRSSTTLSAIGPATSCCARSGCA